MPQWCEVLRRSVAVVARGPGKEDAASACLRIRDTREKDNNLRLLVYQVALHLRRKQERKCDRPRLKGFYLNLKVVAESVAAD